MHGVEHQRRVVVQKGEKSANHGLISAVVELHLRLNYSIARAYSQLKRFGTDIPGPQPSVTTEHTFRWHRRSVQVPCDSADPHRRHSLPTRLSNLAGPLKKEKPPVSFSGVGASTGALCQSPTARERARRQQRGEEVRDGTIPMHGAHALPRGPNYQEFPVTGKFPVNYRHLPEHDIHYPITPQPYKGGDPGFSLSQNDPPARDFQGADYSGDSKTDELKIIWHKISFFWTWTLF